jgi:methylglutaconyl-CoA hydratase
MSTTVLSTIDSRGVATLTLNRPDKHNAFNGELIAELYDLLLQLEGYEAVRLIVLTGAGKSFSAGADLAHMQRMATAGPEENLQDTRAVARCLRKLAEFGKPVIARVNGNAFGGGVGLIACADIAIASDQAKFSLSEVKLGLAAAIISPYVIAAVGTRQAKRLLLTAASLTAQEAAQLGLLHGCVSAKELDQAVENQIELLLQGGPLAQQASKKLLAEISTLDKNRDFTEAHTAALLANLRMSPEGREGLSAFLEKRKPHWIK